MWALAHPYVHWYTLHSLILQGFKSLDLTQPPLSERMMAHDRGCSCQQICSAYLHDDPRLPLSWHWGASCSSLGLLGLRDVGLAGGWFNRAAPAADQTELVLCPGLDLHDLEESC